jgi:hypothetical protein
MSTLRVNKIYGTNLGNRVFVPRSTVNVSTYVNNTYSSPGSVTSGTHPANSYWIITYQKLFDNTTLLIDCHIPGWSYANDGSYYCVNVNGTLYYSGAGSPVLSVSGTGRFVRYLIPVRGVDITRTYTEKLFSNEKTNYGGVGVGAGNVLISFGQHSINSSANQPLNNVNPNNSNDTRNQQTGSVATIYELSNVTYI